MSNVFVADFGEKNRIKTFRVNGAKSDLIRLVEECVNLDTKFIEHPEIKHVHRSEWTVVLKIELPQGDDNNFGYNP